MDLSDDQLDQLILDRMTAVTHSTQDMLTTHRLLPCAVELRLKHGDHTIAIIGTPAEGHMLWEVVGR